MDTLDEISSVALVGCMLTYPRLHRVGPRPTNKHNFISSLHTTAEHYRILNIQHTLRINASCDIMLRDID